MRRTPERTDTGTQVIPTDLIEEDSKDLLTDELNVPNLTLVDSFVTDDSNDSYKPMGISPVLGSLEQAEDNSETFELVKPKEEFNDPFEYFRNIIKEEKSEELSVLEPPPTNGNVKKRKRNYSSEMVWDVTVSKNQRKRTATAQAANLQMSRVGIEIFTSYLFIYIQDLDSCLQHKNDYDN